MLTVQNTIAIKFGNYFEGSAEGPLAIGALLLIAVLVVAILHLAYSHAWRFDGAMPLEPFVREKFTRERTAARKFAAEYFQRFPKERYQTEVESWRHLQSQNIEFTMKRLREPVESGG